jgi:hypothetical protein
MAFYPEFTHQLSVTRQHEAESAAARAHLASTVPDARHPERNRRHGGHVFGRPAGAARA